jgi:prolyl oligopeptidase
VKKNFVYCSILLLIRVIVSAQNYSLPKTILSEKPHSETHFGKTIQDPYRYIENNKDSLTQKWFKENSLKTNKLLNQISGRESIINQLNTIEKRITFNITKLTYSADYIFYLKKNNSDKTAKLYCNDIKAEKEIFLYDPTNYKSESNNNYIITYIKPSWNNKTVALGLSKNGAEIGEIAFLDFESKTILPQIIKNAWPDDLGGINWLPDNSGIIYVNLPVIDPSNKNYILNTESVIYKLGDDPTKHKVILSKQNNPELNIDSADFPVIDKFETTDKYIICYLAGATSYIDYFYAKIDELYSDKINWQPLFKKEDGLQNPSIIGNYLYCLSSNNAPNFKIIKTTIQNPDFRNPEVIVPESITESIRDYVFTKDGLFYSTSKNGVEAKLYYVDNDKNIKSIPLPVKAGTITLETKNKSSVEL